MEQAVREYVKTCKCGKPLEPEGGAPFKSIRTTSPLKLICIDLWSAEDTLGNMSRVLQNRNGHRC